MEKEKTLKSAQEMKMEEGQIVVSQENVQGELQDQSFVEIQEKIEELPHDDGQKNQYKEEEEGDPSSQNLKARKDDNHVLTVGEIRVSLGKEP
jgi:hypothetical protein